ncbi:MAG: PAS domain S-box protein [Rhodomicrobium sp.]
MFFQLTGRAGLLSSPRERSWRITPAGLEWAAGTGLFYFLAAWLALPLATPEGVAQFWPASGVAAGALLAAGRSAFVPIAAAVTAASFLANWLDGRSASACLAFALGNTGEALTVAMLAGRWLDRPFKLDRLNSVLGLFAAAALGTATWEAVTAAVYGLVTRTGAGFWDVWGLLLWANLTGIVMVAPVLAGFAAVVRKPPSWPMTIEGSAVLFLHALASAHAFGLLPFEYSRWMLIAPLSSQLPLLLWLAVRCGPLFAALGTLVLGVAMVCSFSIEHGRFADAAFSIDQRLLAMHFAMLAIAFVALAIAALIAERRNAELAAKRSEARLKLSLNAGNFGTWEVEPASGSFQASERALSCFGLPPGFPAPLSAVMSTLHPGDRQLCEATFQRVAREGGDFESECRVLRPGGSVRWLHIMGGATEDALGGPRRIAGAVRDITEQKSIASLKESAEQLRLFVEQAPVAIAMFDRQMRYLAASQRWMTSYGLNRRGLIGSSAFATVQNVPDAWKEVLQRAIAGEVLSGDQDPAVLGDGQTHWLRWEARPWRTSNGSTGGIVVFTDDVTARVKAERALRESREDLDRAQAVARTGSWRLDVNRNELTWSAETYRIFGVQAGTPLTYESFLDTVHPGDREFVDRSWNAAVAGAPYDIEHRIVALGETRWVRERAELEHDAERLLGGFGTVQDITDKKLAEEELFRLQRLTQLISDRAPDAIFLTDESGRITYANPEAEHLFEFGSKEMLSQDLHNLLHHHHASGEVFPRDECPMAKFQDAGATVRNHEDVFFRKDGSPVDVSCSFAPLERESNRSGGVFVVRDISAEKAARAALRESEERLRLSNEAAGIGTFTLDLVANRAYYSVELATMLGFPGVRTASIEDAFRRVHRDDVARVRAQFEGGLSGAGGGQIKMDFRFVRPGGEIRWMTWIGRVEFRDRPKGREPFRVAGACVDITDRKRADEAAAQLAAIVASSSDAIIGTAVDGTVTSWNEAAARLYGYSYEEMIGQGICRLIPPSLHSQEGAKLAKAAAGTTVEAYETIRVDKNGRPIQVSVSVSPIRDAAGKIIGVSKIARDITGRKRAEEAMRESEERLRAIFGSAADAMVVIDEDARIHSVNPAAGRMFGYTQSELIGNDISKLMPEPHRSQHRAYIEAYCKTGIPKIIGRPRELQHQRKDGTLFPADLTVAEWRVGGKRYFTGVVRDITERKRNEDKVQLLLREVNHRSKNMLALVQAIASRTAAPDHVEFMKRFSERLSALAASQDLLVSSGWQGVETGALVQSQLSHFKSLIDDRIKLKGQALKLSASAAQTIGMALHELATNAGKYGALSRGTGSIEIEWQLCQAADGSQLFEMMWAEHGGPQVSPPARSGFGNTVIETIPRMELDAEIMLDYAPEGLRWHLCCPSKSVLESQHNGNG